MEPLDRLVESLRRWGVLRTQRVEDALRVLDWHELLPHVPGREGFLQAPYHGPDGLFEPSPRLSVLLVELLEIQPGVRVALPAPRPRVLHALVEALGGVPHDALRHGPAQRAVELLPAPRAVALAPDGFSLRVNLDPHAESMQKRIMTGEKPADMVLDNVLLPEDGAEQRPLRMLLVLEGFARRALANRPRTRQDEQFAEGVGSVWRPNAQQLLAMGPESLHWARRWFHVAYIHQAFAAFPDAIDLYQASLDAHPTAEAHTFLGWSLSFLGDIKGAIRKCEDAIDVDPTLGNPYNDIGAYLIELDRPEIALPWFERALASPRYEAPHFAHCNAGRALLALGRTDEARIAFERSLAIAPNYRPPRDFLRRMDGEHPHSH